MIDSINKCKVCNYSKLNCRICNSEFCEENKIHSQILHGLWVCGDCCKSSHDLFKNDQPERSKRENTEK